MVILRILILFGFSFCFIHSSHAAEVVGQNDANRIDTAIFASAGHVRRPYLSPDGSKIVYREQISDRTYLTTKFLDGAESYRVAMPQDAELRWYRWAGDQKLLFSVSSVREYGKVEFRQVGLYLIDIATRKARSIGPGESGLDSDNVLFIDPDGQYIIMSIRPSVYQYPRVFRVDITTNKPEEIVSDQFRIWNWITDNKGVVRLGISYRVRSTLIYYRSKEGEKFRRIGKLKANDDDEEEEEALVDIYHIISEADEGYILSNKETGRFALYKFNFLTRETGEMIFGHETNDVTSYDMNADGSVLESVRYTDSRDRIKWFDEELAAQQRLLDRTLVGQEAWIVSKSEDGSKMIVLSTSASDPGSYYLYEPAARKMDRFAGINDKLNPDQLSLTKYETYTARDGTTISAYVTVPKGKEAKNLPLIIMPHGGPFGVRDTLDYNSEVQFLANRGYVVLQPNFRGSGSYGEKFYEIGEGQIGRAMQDDLDDGMDWLVKRQIVDPKRVCIVGSSYGGYAALWGVTRNPERYRCAASFAGVTDWNKQLRYDRRFLSSRYSRDWKAQIQGEDDFDLDDVSPVRVVDELTRPILLAHGKKDSNVPYTQFTLYKNKLKNRRTDAVFLTYDEEGHGLADAKNRKDWLDQLDEFLAKHNPS